MICAGDEGSRMAIQSNAIYREIYREIMPVYIYMYKFLSTLVSRGQVPGEGLTRLQYYRMIGFLNRFLGRVAITYIILARTRLEDGKTLYL